MFPLNAVTSLELDNIQKRMKYHVVATQTVLFSWEKLKALAKERDIAQKSRDAYRSKLSSTRFP